MSEKKYTLDLQRNNEPRYQEILDVLKQYGCTIISQTARTLTYKGDPSSLQSAFADLRNAGVSLPVAKDAA